MGSRGGRGQRRRSGLHKPSQTLGRTEQGAALSAPEAGPEQWYRYSHASEPQREKNPRCFAERFHDSGWGIRDRRAKLSQPRTPTSQRRHLGALCTPHHTATKRPPTSAAAEGLWARAGTGRWHLPSRLRLGARLPPWPWCGSWRCSSEVGGRGREEGSWRGAGGNEGCLAAAVCVYRGEVVCIQVHV